jgi:multisubunit Na+/H+ antiporter MnhG subunit
METVFMRYRLLPLASGYVRSAEPGTGGIVGAATLLLMSFALAWVERLAVTTMGGYLMLVAVLIAVTIGARAVDRASRRAPVLDLDEPTPLPTQRLELMG